MRTTLFLLSCLATIAFTGCTGDSNLPEATGDATFRAINAISTSPQIGFFIEERLIGNADFQGTANPAEFDDLEYTFNFEVLLAGELTRSRVASLLLKAERDREYTFLISGALAAPTITLWEDEQRVWEGTETVFQARFAHTSESRGPIDVYFQAPGIPPAMGQEVGTLSFAEILPAVDYPAGDYVVIFTTAGNPGDILLTSDTLTPAAQTGITITVFDAAANDLGLISARLIPDIGGSFVVPDANTSPTVRFFHATPNLETADVYTDDMLADQILEDHAYRDITGDLPIDPGMYTFTYTLANDVGMILHEGVTTINPGVRNQFYVVGEVGTLVSFIRIPDRRSVETLVKFSFLHTATNHDLVDVFIVTAGTDIADSIPRFIDLNIGSTPVTAALQEGDFELYLTTAEELTVLAGPIAFSPVLGDVVDYISYDNVDPAIADVVSIPLP